MYLSKKQKDAKRIDDLAMLCRGKIGAVAVLAASYKGVSTVDDAAKRASQPNLVSSLLARSDFLYFRWISEAMDETRTLLSTIDFNVIESVRQGNFSTRTIFEAAFVKIVREIDEENGVLACLQKIAQDELRRKDPKESIFRLITQIKEAALEMKGLCRRLLNPWMYPITDARLGIGLLILAAIPLCYHLLQYRPILSTAPPPIGMDADISRLVKVFNQRNAGLWNQILDSLQIISQTALLLPSFFFLAAVLLTIVRQVLPAGGSPNSRIKGAEKTLYSLGRSFQDQLPKPPTGPIFVFRRSIVSTFNNSGSGPQNNNTGSGTQNNNSGSGSFINNDAIGSSDKKLEDEIKQLRTALKAKTRDTPEEDVAIAEVAKAEKAAKDGDSRKALSILGGAGKWVLDVAKEIGIKVITETISSSMK